MRVNLLWCASGGVDDIPREVFFCVLRICLAERRIVQAARMEN